MKVLHLGIGGGTYIATEEFSPSSSLDLSAWKRWYYYIQHINTFFDNDEDGINWGRLETSYQTISFYFGDELARAEHPHILWKDGEPECFFRAYHDQDPSAGLFL